MAYLVNLGCFGERVVEDADEALEFVQTHYPDGVIYSLADVDDPAIGETPIYENDDESDDFAIGTVYPYNRNRDRLPLQGRVSGAGDRSRIPSRRRDCDLITSIQF